MYNDNDNEITFTNFDKNELETDIDNIETNIEENVDELYEKYLKSRKDQDLNPIEQEKYVEELENKLIYQQDNRKKGYFELLPYFLHEKEWVKKTNIHCWWCCNTFETVPIGLPVDYITLSGKFRVVGVFCGFPCSIAYKKSELKNIDDYLIKFLHKKITGEDIDDYNNMCAPPRCTLKMFGGDLSIEEFRESVKSKHIFSMIRYPMFISREYVEEVDLATIKKANPNIFKKENTNEVPMVPTVPTKPVVSSASKHTVTGSNTIDKFINF